MKAEEIEKIIFSLRQVGPVKIEIGARSQASQRKNQIKIKIYENNLP